MLITTGEGILNTDHIVTVEPPATVGGRSIVRFTNGTHLALRDNDADLIEQACGMIVPAQPGFDLIGAIMPDPDETVVVYTVEPVIAFRVGAGRDDLHPVPITLTGEPLGNGCSFWTVRQPNGTCEGQDMTHDDLDAFKAFCERIARDHEMDRGIDRKDLSPNAER